jgi:hypothetical protein
VDGSCLSRWWLLCGIEWIAGYDMTTVLANEAGVATSLKKKKKRNEIAPKQAPMCSCVVGDEPGSQGTPSDLTLSISFRYAARISWRKASRDTESVRE